MTVNVIKELDDESYLVDDGRTIKRENGKTPNGNPIGLRWVLRGPNGEWIDFDTYRHDLFERHNLYLNDKLFLE